VMLMKSLTPHLSAWKDSGFCPNHWVPYAGHCYDLQRVKTSWKDALSACHKEGADLASVHNIEEHSFIISQMGYCKCLTRAWTLTLTLNLTPEHTLTLQANNYLYFLCGTAEVCVVSSSQGHITGTCWLGSNFLWGPDAQQWKKFGYGQKITKQKQPGSV